MRGQSINCPGGNSGGNFGGYFGSCLFQPVRQQLKENILDRTLRQRFELLMRLGTFAVHVREKFTHGEDQVPQIVGGVVTGVQRPFFDFLLEHLADGIIEQGIFILKVRVKRGAVDLGFVGHILHGDGFESFFSEEISQRIAGSGRGSV